MEYGKLEEYVGFIANDYEGALPITRENRVLQILLENKKHQRILYLHKSIAHDPRKICKKEIEEKAPLEEFLKSDKEKFEKSLLAACGINISKK